MKKYKVYIASKYSLGNKIWNIINSFKIYNDLLKLDFIPYAPLHSHFIDKYYPQDYDTWLEIDFNWILACDVLYRVSGESKGADKEVDFAILNKIPVFTNINDLLTWKLEKDKIFLDKSK
jgi:hypothetical protein